MRLGVPFSSAEHKDSYRKKHQCWVACTKANWAKGKANQRKQVLEQIELYALLNQNVNVKFLINTRQCAAALS